ncbi:unnamed protein product [Prunus armeniaca]
MLNQEQRCRNREQLNCLPLSVTMAFVFDLSCRYCCEGFGLSLFGKVIDGHDCEFKLTRALRHWADEVESPLGEWPRASHRTEWFGKGRWYGSETLTRIAPLHNLGGVSVESWLIIALLNGLEGQGSGSQVVSTRAFVYLTQDVVSLLRCNTPQQRKGVASPIEDALQQKVASRSSSYCLCFGFVSW